jgi:hypothetical protein
MRHLSVRVSYQQAFILGVMDPVLSGVNVAPAISAPALRRVPGPSRRSWPDDRRRRPAARRRSRRPSVRPGDLRPVPPGIRPASGTASSRVGGARLGGARLSGERETTPAGGLAIPSMSSIGSMSSMPVEPTVASMGSAGSVGSVGSLSALGSVTATSTQSVLVVAVVLLLPLAWLLILQRSSRRPPPRHRSLRRPPHWPPHRPMCAWPRRAPRRSQWTPMAVTSRHSARPAGAGGDVKIHGCPLAALLPGSPRPEAGSPASVHRIPGACRGRRGRGDLFR